MDIGTAMGAGWSSGISVYGVVALVGVAGRVGWIEAPSFVEHRWVIAVSIGLFLVEFVIDKIALVDSVWDGVHAVIRPAVGRAPGAEQSQREGVDPSPREHVARAGVERRRQRR